MAAQLGVCPVASAMQHDGANGGQAAGRICWRVKQSGNRLACTSAQDFNGCHNCQFYRRVVFEERDKVRYRLTPTHS